MEPRSILCHLDNPFLLQPKLMLLMHVVWRINNISTVLKVSRNNSWSWNLATAKIAKLVQNLCNIWSVGIWFGTAMNGK
jgi:hypothetical protein